MLCLKIAGGVANGVDPDEMPHSAVSYLGLHCLPRPVCLNTYGKYGMTYILENIYFEHLSCIVCPRQTKVVYGYFYCR